MLQFRSKGRIVVVTWMPEAWSLSEQIAIMDPEGVRAIARADYEVLRLIARKPGLSIAARGAEVDGELDRMTLAHVLDKSPDQAGQFIQMYNAEYNRLVTEKLQGNTGCARSVVITVTIGPSGMADLAFAVVP
jgi:hypothetical protein